jgi:hypothetical protein
MTARVSTHEHGQHRHCIDATWPCREALPDLDEESMHKGPIYSPPAALTYPRLLAQQIDSAATAWLSAW